MPQKKKISKNPTLSFYIYHQFFYFQFHPFTPCLIGTYFHSSKESQDIQDKFDP